ncbi:MAG: SufD family Fe-S cluster assembly protein [Halarcobacter sp.]
MRPIDLKNINFPTKKDEEFRKIDLSKLLNDEYDKTKDYALDLTLVDKKLKGLGEFSKINETLESKTYQLKISKDTKEPIVLVHKLDEDKTIYTNSLEIIVEEGVNADVIEIFLSKCQESFYSINRSLQVKQAGNLNYIKYQDIQQSNKIIYNCDTNLKKEASLYKTNFEIGDGINLNLYNTNLNEEDSKYNLFGLVRLKNSANSSSIFNTLHNTKNALSNIKYKHSLHDKSKAVYEAKSIVNQKALNSKVFQASNTILLSNDATIFAKPHLEISIDELEASHAATTGGLDKDQLHYLQTRGIPKDMAFGMLLKAFENEIFDTIVNEKAKELILGFKRSDYV